MLALEALVSMWVRPKSTPPPPPKIHTPQIPREMALELVSEADFWCKVMSGGRPVDLRGSRGSISWLNPGKPARKLYFYPPFETDPGGGALPLRGGAAPQQPPSVKFVGSEGSGAPGTPPRVVVL